MKYLDPPARTIYVLLAPTESAPGRPIRFDLTDGHTTVQTHLSIGEARRLHGELGKRLLNSDEGMEVALRAVYEFSQEDEADWEPVRKSIVSALVNRGLIEDPERF